MTRLDEEETLDRREGTLDEGGKRPVRMREPRDH